MSHEAASNLIEHFILLRDHWVGTGGDASHVADGLLFSILSTLDGVNAAMPAFDVVPSLHEEDNPDAYLPLKSGEPINHDVMLHELYSRMTKPRAGISFSPTEPVLFEGTNVLHVAKPILVRSNSSEQLNNVFVADSAQKRLLETVEFARGRGILGGAGPVNEAPNCLLGALQRLSIPKEKRVLLYNDFSQHSFLFQTYRETESGWVGSYNGGLIYYGAGDTGVSAPTFSVRIGSDLPEGWSINT